MATGKTLPDFDALWDYDQPAKTEAAFRALLPQAEASGDSSYYIELLTQIARTQGLQRDFAAAHQGVTEEPIKAKALVVTLAEFSKLCFDGNLRRRNVQRATPAHSTSRTTRMRDSVVASCPPTGSRAGSRTRDSHA